MITTSILHPPPPLCIANSMHRILITLEVILITDIRQVISNSGMSKIQINMKSIPPCTNSCAMKLLMVYIFALFFSFRAVTEDSSRSKEFLIFLPLPPVYLSFKHGYLF